MNRKYFFVSLVLFFGLVGSAIFMLPYSIASEDDSRLTIIFTHDLHSNFEPTKIINDQKQVETRGGLAGLAGVIAEERDKKPGQVLVVDAGDFSMGTLLQTLFTTHAPELCLMGLAGWDATTLGNHEFDYDSSGLAAMLNTSRDMYTPLPVIVASNISLEVDKDDKSDLKSAFQSYPIEEYMIIEKGGIRIGVFGLMGQDAANTIIKGEDIKVENPVKSAQKVTKVLKDKEKVDLIVCLSHCGTITEGDSEDEILASKVPDIDVIISGHSHTTLTEPIIKNNTIIGSAGPNGLHAGIIELLVKSGQEPQLVDYRLQKISPETPVVSAINGQINIFKNMVDDQFLARYGLTYNQIVAESAFNLQSPETMEENPVETGLGNLIADAFRHAVREAEGPKGEYVHAAVIPQGEIRSSLTAGPLDVNEVFKVLSLGQGFDQTIGYPLVTFYLTGKEIKSCLEVQSSIAPTDPKYNLQVSGIKFKYNMGRLRFDRVYDIEISTPDGKFEPIESTKLYRISTTYYTAAMISSLREKTYKILSAIPKNSDGLPIEDLSTALVDADPSQTGVQELKGWKSLADFLSTQKDVNGNGIPDIPNKYIKPAGNYTEIDSAKPGDLLRDATAITWGAYLIVAVFAIICGLLARRLIPKRQKRQKRRR